MIPSHASPSFQEIPPPSQDSGYVFGTYEPFGCHYPVVGIDGVTYMERMPFHPNFSFHVVPPTATHVCVCLFLFIVFYLCSLVIYKFL